MSTGLADAVRQRTDITLGTRKKGKKDKQWTRKHYRENLGEGCSKINFPIIWSNISAAPTYEFNISALVQYPRACESNLSTMQMYLFFNIHVFIIYMCLCLVIKMNCMYTWWVDWSMSYVNCVQIVPSCCWRGLL